MKNLTIKIVIAVLVFSFGLLCSCTPNPTRRVPATNLKAVAGANQTEIYINRANNKTVKGYVGVFLNNSLVAEVANNSIEKIIVPNGTHEISVGYGGRTSPPPIRFNADGRRLDFRTNIWSGVYGSGFTFEQEGVRRSTYVVRSGEQLLRNVSKGSKIAIIITSTFYQHIADNILSELEVIWVNDGYTIVDRRQLDRIRQEQDFQMSGEVDDETAVSIGKFAGADIIVTGELDLYSGQYRLRLRALNTQTAQVVGASMERSP